jgi:hypothetical protein
MVGIAIGIGLLLLVVAIIAIAKRNDSQYKKWKDWYDNLPPDERRKVQEELYKEHIYRG